eukprot:g8408.t1 g8408   contig3:20594-21109(+)
MIQEEKNVEFRRARMEYAMEKVRVGEERKRARIERERMKKSLFLQWDTKKKLANQRLATTVQRVYRGHLGRKVAKMRAFQLQSAHSADILMNACAPAIGKVWRDTGIQNLRKEVAEFLSAIREEEANYEESEYLMRKRIW